MQNVLAEEFLRVGGLVGWLRPKLKLLILPRGGAATEPHRKPTFIGW